jgi:hypothetical protein
MWGGCRNVVGDKKSRGRKDIGLFSAQRGQRWCPVKGSVH